MYKRCLFLKKDTNCKEQRSMAEKFEHVRLSCSGTTANSDNFTQQSSLLVVEAFATKPCWTSYWVSFRDVASYFGCCRKGLCFFWKPPRHLGGAWDFVTCSAYREACAGEGKNYIAFLRELLQFFAEAYERDPQMKARLLLALIYIQKAGKLFVGSCGGSVDDIICDSFFGRMWYKPRQLPKISFAWSWVILLHKANFPPCQVCKKWP